MIAAYVTSQPYDPGRPAAQHLAGRPLPDSVGVAHLVVYRVHRR
jgi:hypothetical protein